MARLLLPARVSFGSCNARRSGANCRPSVTYAFCFCAAATSSSPAIFAMSTSSSPSQQRVRDMVAPDPPSHLYPEYENNVLLRTPTRMNYVTPDTHNAKVRRDKHGDDSPTEGVTFVEQDVWVHNARRHNVQLRSHGFALLSDKDFDADTKIDFTNKDNVMDHYYPHCEALLQNYLQQHSGSSGVTVTAFDHNVRQQQQGDVKAQKPIGLVHGDYTTVSGPRRLEQLACPPKRNDVWRERLGDNALLDAQVVQECLAGQRRFALINVWRSIDRDHAIGSFPLACLDARSVPRSDLRVLQIHYTDRIGENFLLAAPNKNTDHVWMYFPHMTFDETLLIKQWDSHGNLAGGAARDTDMSSFAMHSAFVDPRTQQDDPPRQSIEVRCVAIWDKVEKEQ